MSGRERMRDEDRLRAKNGGDEQKSMKGIGREWMRVEWSEGKETCERRRKSVEEESG